MKAETARGTRSPSKPQRGPTLWGLWCARMVDCQVSFESARTLMQPYMVLTEIGRRNLDISIH